MNFLRRTITTSFQTNSNSSSTSSSNSSTAADESDTAGDGGNNNSSNGNNMNNNNNSQNINENSSDSNSTPLPRQQQQQHYHHHHHSGGHHRGIQYGQRQRSGGVVTGTAESTSNITRDEEDDDDDHIMSGSAVQVAGSSPYSRRRSRGSNSVRPRPELYPKFIVEQLRTTHSNLDTLVFTRQTLERIEDIRLEARNLLAQLWHQHVYLVPDALKMALNANERAAAVTGVPMMTGSSSSLSSVAVPHMTNEPTVLGVDQHVAERNDVNAVANDLVLRQQQPIQGEIGAQQTLRGSISAPPLSDDTLVMMGINYNDNSRYEGELDQHRVRQGHGTYFYPSGTVYRGQWNQGSRHGLGICEFVSGNKYVGYWNQGRREGRGVFMFTKSRQKISDLPIPGIRAPKQTILSIREQIAHDADVADRFGSNAMVRISGGNAQLRLPSSLGQEAQQQQPLVIPVQSFSSVFDTSEMMPTSPEPTHVIRTTPPVFDISSVPDFVASDPSLCGMVQRLLSFEDQERYEGEFKLDQRHGFGVYYFPDGSCYAGMWKNNRRHGKGTYFFTSGRIYEGEWLSSMRHGNGVMRDVDGHVLYTGQWVNDRKHGIGTQYENGDWITAQWSSNRIEKRISVQLLPLRANLRRFLFSDYIPGISYDAEELVIAEQLQHIELSGEEKQQQQQQQTLTDPQQQDLEPPDIEPILYPYQNYFRDVDIITHH